MSDDEEEDDVETAIDLIDDALELIDDLPDRAEEFGESAGETLRDIRNSIEQRNSVTLRQWQAIKNITTGIERWLD